MNDQPILTPPETPDESTEKWETAVLESARQFAYPPTPDIAGSVRARLHNSSRRGAMRTLRMVATALLALALVLLAVPQTRAFVLDVLRIGAVRIFYGEPTAMLTETPTTTPPANSGVVEKGSATPRPTQTPTATPLASALDLSGETTLADAEQQLGSPILLPGYPPELGAPDRVFAQKIGQGVVVTLVWTKPDDAAQVDLLLQVLNADTVAAKYFPWDADNEQPTTVRGRRAYWLTGVHQLFIFQNGVPNVRDVDKNVLIWDEGALTYRLETDVSLDEARQIAESLR